MPSTMAMPMYRVSFLVFMFKRKTGSRRWPEGLARRHGAGQDGPVTDMPGAREVLRVNPWGAMLTPAT
ncbi:hypothetical protein D3C85_656510 [compost metagenome]